MRSRQFAASRMKAARIAPLSFSRATEERANAWRNAFLSACILAIAAYAAVMPFTK